MTHNPSLAPGSAILREVPGGIQYGVIMRNDGYPAAAYRPEVYRTLNEAVAAHPEIAYN